MLTELFIFSGSLSGRRCSGVALLIMLFVVFFIPCLNAQETQRSKLAVTEYKLPNGLQVMIYEDHSAPVVSAQIWYKVGAYNEPKGLTGISHLLEHMAFKGTKKVSGKEYSKIIERNGGDENGFTGRHYTCYFANLARDRYHIELELEADRMQNLLIDSVAFIPEKGVVMEERRLGDNDPFDALWEEFFSVAYKTHPYQNPVIGWMDDLARITHRDVRKYYETYYNPANSLVILSGDVKPEEGLKIVKKYFGKINGTTIKEPAYIEPEQSGERRFEYKREVETPAVMIGYHVPNVNHPDAYTLDVVSYILTRGKSSRLYKRLVYDERIALNISGSAWTDKYSGIFYFLAIPQLGQNINKLQNIIYQEIEKLKTEPVSDEELERVKNQVLADFVFAKDGVTRMGFEIAFMQIITGDYRYIETYEDKIARVSKDDIISAAKKYFVMDNRTVGVLVPVVKDEGVKEEK